MKIVVGQINSTIEAHGDITKANSQGAAKRIVKGTWGQLKTILLQSDKL